MDNSQEQIPTAAKNESELKDALDSQALIRAKMQVSNSIMQSIYQLKSCAHDYEKDFITRGIKLNFEYLGRMEFDKIQKELVKQQQAAAPVPEQSAPVSVPENSV